MPLPDAPDAMPASGFLRQAEDLLGSGGTGDTPMARLAAQAAERARATGDAETEALAQFYILLGLVGTMPQADLMVRVDAARARCAALGVPRALWLLDDLEAAICMHDGRHMATIAICQRLDRLAPDVRPAFERSVSIYYLSFAHQWLGHYDQTLRLRFRYLQLAEQAGRPLWIASACICLGAFLTQETLDPEKGLPYLQRARDIWRTEPLTGITLVATTVFTEDTGRPGAMAVVDSQRARLTLALIGVGRLDEAQAWLDALPARYLTVAKDGFPIAPLMRLRLLCAQRRFAEARALAEAATASSSTCARPTTACSCSTTCARPAKRWATRPPPPRPPAQRARPACRWSTCRRGRATWRRRSNAIRRMRRRCPRSTSDASRRSRARCRPSRTGRPPRRCHASWRTWCTSCATRSAA